MEAIMPIGRYDYDGLLNAFLYQHETSGSTAEGRMSFSGNTLKSYSSVLAQLGTYPKSQKTVLFIDNGIANYSTTTSKHTSLMRRINPYPEQFWNLDKSVEQNLLYLINYIDILLIKHKRARSNKPFIASNILATHANLIRLLDEYSIDKRTALYKQAMKYPFIFFANKLIKEQ